MKMYNRKTFLLLLTVISLAASCTSDFISANLKKKTVTLNSPPNNYVSKDATMLFWWNEVKGAEEYKLQVVDSSFSYIRSLVLDTSITGTKFSFTFKPGNYQWRVRALNNASQTEYTEIRSFSIDSTNNLSNNTLILVSPSDNFTSNTTSNTFSWSEMYAADDYRFQVINTQSNVTLIDVTLAELSTQYTFAEGQYKWQVRAQNSSSNSAYSIRNFTIDTSPPTVSTQSSPANNAVVANPVPLIWARDAAAIGDSLIIYPDSLISAPIYVNYTTSTSYNFNGNSGQYYFWKLKSKDLAGNWSTQSSLRKFKVL